MSSNRGGDQVHINLRVSHALRIRAYYWIAIAGLALTQNFAIKHASAAELLKFSDLSASQTSYLKQQIKFFAVVQFSLNTCGRPTDFESEVRAAAKDCIANASLSEAAAIFRAEIVEMRAPPPSNVSAFCSDPQIRDINERAMKNFAMRLEQLIKACKFRAIF